GRGLVDGRIQADEFAGLRFTDETLPEPTFMQEAETRISSAAIGTATHLVMQRVDLSTGAPSQADLRALVADLVDQELIEDKVAHLISLSKIERFFTNSPLGKQMVAHADSLQREVQFSLLLDADRLYKDFQGSEKVLIHGIIDGYFQVDDEVWLFDYKTDRVTPETAAETLTQRYSGQLNVYAQALVAMGKPMPRRFIYAFSAEKIIALD
ncbi:MAG: PD-(D/E)XK nuclease family protein, partial [Weissella cibaria]